MPTEIKCPNCGHAFEPNDAIREEVEKELRNKAAEWQKKKNDEFQIKLEEEKKKLHTTLEENLRKNISSDFETKLRLLEQNNRENEEKLKQSRQKELEYLRLQQELKNKEEEIDLTIQKKLLPDAQFHFSISHCGDYAAAIVSQDRRVGIDIEIPLKKITRIADKFLSENEKNIFQVSNHTETQANLQQLTLLWSTKEAIFKWYGDGGVDFRQHIHLLSQSSSQMKTHFVKTGSGLIVDYKIFDALVLTWVVG